MSTTPELKQLETILEQVLPDPRGYAERVMQQMMARMATTGNGAPVDDGAHQALVDRNVLLAAALGACECWGEDLNCPNCGGDGSTGWTDPDPRLFVEYIQPALTRMTRAVLPARGLDTPNAGEPE
jgi:hypothetical protein